MQKSPVFFAVLVLNIVVLGCEGAKPTPRTEVAPVVQPPAPVQVAEPVPAPAQPEAVPAEAKQPEEPKVETVRVKAQAGVTGKGNYGDGGGEKASDILTVPVKTFWRTKERVVFEIQVPEALKLYKAMHDDKAPATHEEYMKDVIEANMIPLPSLPSGHKYVYNPATEELEVEKPK